METKICFNVHLYFAAVKRNQSIICCETSTVVLKTIVAWNSESLTSISHMTGVVSQILIDIN